MSGRTIAIGDIHGCSIALRALLAAIAPQPHDTLVTLGDYVDKGVDSKGVMEVLLELESRCRLVPLLGNHDAVMLGAIQGQLSVDAWKGIGGTATLQSYGDSERVDDIPHQHADLLRRCRLCHETATHFFVHAGYEPERSLDQQDEASLLWGGIRGGVPGRHCSGKTAVVGHTSQKNGEILDAGHLICIDTYCWNGGWLTALELETQTVWQVNERGQSR